MVEANPGDRTGGGKNKEAVHRTPAQAKKRHGPGGNEMHDDAEMEREQGALKPFNANIAPQAPAVKRQKPRGRFHITQKKPPRSHRSENRRG